MAMPYPNGGAVAGVRLTDIPLNIRRRYGSYLYDQAAKDGDFDLALSLYRAVENPSDRVYWLPREVVHEVRERQKW